MARVARITVISHRAIGAARRAELFGEGLSLDHAVGGQPRSTAVIQAVFHGIHLAAHGVGHNEQLPALGRLPRAPGHCVQRRDAHKPYLERACDALRRRQGDAHAGERPRAGAHSSAMRGTSWVFDARRASTSTLATSSIDRAAASNRPKPMAMTSLAVSKASTYDGVASSTRHSPSARRLSAAQTSCRAAGRQIFVPYSTAATNTTTTVSGKMAHLCRILR